MYNTVYVSSERYSVPILLHIHIQSIKNNSTTQEVCIAQHTHIITLRFARATAESIGNKLFIRQPRQPISSSLNRNIRSSPASAVCKFVPIDSTALSPLSPLSPLSLYHALYLRPLCSSLSVSLSFSLSLSLSFSLFLSLSHSL